MPEWWAQYPEYTYEPLPNERTYVRLLRLGKITPESIEISLQTFALDNLPSYTALSYQWKIPGQLTAEYPLVVRTGSSYRRLKVPMNLATFILFLAEAEETAAYYRAETWIFADAVCLNQKDGEETRSQMSLMGYLYRNASRVYCWLGPPRVELEALCKYSIFDKEHRHDSPAAKRRKYIDIFGEFDRLALWDCTRELCDLPYWNRLWIVQEIILAKDLRFFTKGTGFELSDIERLMPSSLPGGLENSVADGHGLFDDSYVPTATERRMDLGATNLNSVRTRFLRKLTTGRLAKLLRERQMRTARSLESAIMEFGHSECKYPIDRVYGLLGLGDASANSAFGAESEDEIALFFRVLRYCAPQKPLHFARELHSCLKLSDRVMNPTGIPSGFSADVQRSIPWYVSSLRFRATIELVEMRIPHGCYIGQPIPRMSSITVVRSFPIYPGVDLSNERSSKILSFPILDLTGYSDAQGIEYGDSLCRISGTRFGLVFSRHFHRFRGRFVLADPKCTEQADSFLTHQWTFCQSLAQNCPKLSDSRRTAEFQITDARDILVLAMDIEELWM